MPRPAITNGRKNVARARNCAGQSIRAVEIARSLVAGEGPPGCARHHARCDDSPRARRPHGCVVTPRRGLHRPAPAPFPMWQLGDRARSPAPFLPLAPGASSRRLPSRRLLWTSPDQTRARHLPSRNRYGAARIHAPAPTHEGNIDRVTRSRILDERLERLRPPAKARETSTRFPRPAPDRPDRPDRSIRSERSKPSFPERSPGRPSPRPPRPRPRRRNRVDGVERPPRVRGTPARQPRTPRRTSAHRDG